MYEKDFPLVVGIKAVGSWLRIVCFLMFVRSIGNHCLLVSWWNVIILTKPPQINLCSHHSPCLLCNGGSDYAACLLWTQYLSPEHIWYAETPFLASLGIWQSLREKSPSKTGHEESCHVSSLYTHQGRPWDGWHIQEGETSNLVSDFWNLTTVRNRSSHWVSGTLLTAV